MKVSLIYDEIITPSEGIIHEYKSDTQLDSNDHFTSYSLLHQTLHNIRKLSYVTITRDLKFIVEQLKNNIIRNMYVQKIKNRLEDKN